MSRGRHPGGQVRRSGFRVHMARMSSWACLAAIWILLPAGGCGSRVPPVPPPPLAGPASGVTETGYAVQIGAFSVLSNAVRLTERLRGLGEDVYYFRHESGLYKVRLGDFPSRDAANAKAMDLVGRGLVDVFYIVGPSDYALARSRTEGTDLLREEIVRTARGFIGLPYQWGGSSPEQGFDCSGLTMAAYQMNGLNIPRSSREQFNEGRVVGQEELKKGDLVFFSIQSGRKVSHVGLYAGDGTFIHAAGAGKDIRVGSLSNGYFRRCYVGARSFI